jgi:hypothetical protein
MCVAQVLLAACQVLEPGGGVSPRGGFVIECRSASVAIASKKDKQLIVLVNRRAARDAGWMDGVYRVT